MRRTVPPSAEIERKIDDLLASGVAAGEPEGPLSELASLGAQLIIQRAVEEEFDAWLGRARYERKAEAPPGKRNGWRPRRVQSAEGGIEVEVPQLREAAEAFYLEAVPARVEAAAGDRAAQGDGDRCLRARAVDARRRVAL